MAEGGIIQKQDRVRPLLPPKPTGCIPAHHSPGTTAGLKSIRTVTRGSSSGANSCQKSITFKETASAENFTEAGKSTSSITELKKQYECKAIKDLTFKKCGGLEVCEEKCNRKPLSLKKQVLTRPQIFPKPQTPIKSKKVIVNTEPPSPQKCVKRVVSETAVEELSETSVQKVKIPNKHTSSAERCLESKNVEEFCVKADTVSKSEVDSYHVLHIRAPVANFEEFDCLPESDKRDVPVRPPRSPKNKTLQGNIFLKCIEGTSFLSSRDKFISSSPPDILLKKFDNSDTCKVKHLEVKAKSSSLGRFYTRHLSEVHSVNISLDKNGKTPIPPPRRRRKSVTDVLPTKELESKQDLYSHISLIKPQSSFPEYATVNYSQKKNRKNNSEGTVCSNDKTTSINPEKDPKQDTKVNSFIDDRLNLNALKHLFETCNRPDVTHLSKEAARPNTSHSVKNEVQLSEIAAGMDTTAATTFSETCRLDKDVSSNIDNSLLSTEFIKSDNKDKGTVTPENFSVCKSQCEDCPHSGEQDAPRNEIKKSSALPNESDMCATSFQEKSMSDVHDSSSSSKVEWVSVNSSVRNSSNEIGKRVDEIDSSSYKQTCEENINLLKENNDVTILLEKSVVDHVEITTSQKICSDGISSLEVCQSSSNVDTGKVCAISTGSNSTISTQEKTEASSEQKFKYRSAGSEKLIFRLLSDDSLTSSTPSLPCSLTHRNTALNRKHARRLSWSSCRDRVRAMRNEPRGRGNSLSLWYDDGDLSSGALADLDSSDNTARQSSLEDVFQGSECDVAKKSPQWNVYSKSERGLFPNEDCASISSSSQDNEYSLPSMKVVESSAGRKSKVPEQNYMKGDAHSDQEKTDITETSQNSDSEATGHFSKGDAVKLKSSEQKANKAFFIAKELMTSERVFISVLKLLNEDFRQALEMTRKQYQSQIIPDDDFCKIFNSLPQLQSLNEDLLHDLECRIENWQSSKKIADVIVRKGPFLKLYTTYIQNFGAQCSHFDECCQKYPKFFKLVRDFEALPICKKLSIKHFMLKPVQRIPQYRLLLEDYSRQLDSSSPDYEDTQRALKIVCDVADHANRSIKLGDHLSKLLQLQAQLNNYEIIKPGRIFLKEGELFKLSRKDSQPRYFILLNDCLLYTSYYGSGLASGLKVNSELPLGGMKVTTPQAEEFHNEFSIISSTRSFTLMARSQEERQEWVDALQAAIKDYTYRQLSFHKLSAKDNENFSETFKLGKEVPVWIQDGRVTKCQCCVAVFTVTFRRHHCRACGKVVCSNCSDFRAPLQYKRFQPDRVCVDCYESLLAEFQNEGRMKHCIETELRITDYEELSQKYCEIKSHFKKLGSNGRRKFKKYVPQRLLEVTANDTGSQMSGWLLKRKKNSWKRYWFVLKDQVLYIYKASEDVAALETVPVLGYTVEQMKEPFEGRDAKLVFQLKHEGQAPLMFSADSEHSANRWISAVREATVLKE
ncbi:uncharacterized protein LOC126299057 isoform X1 [Schistocerca gregaria]|uniref:uncharacterized protein LOC126299057 isoform X1 n=2 Tax=Schistocerca gregaria TaxID=7010 RepID=UPI00211E5CF7|nr:uncharacterized protein LOC126299057 isoform X1 [Schistocerca gregaria]XP_049846672.1 uncharacterized protein LOC126299057 isoform X1 [Schistocerca gregaria]XP_049846673.1 uncharacterized protein LOC126299057 isoform X1 [Schistocerca gregaria]XP_049846674.1 uncharacterized protein LOC126299057 isoform X1 [Schistocerca gregaria]XP_049846675.1 uncharacterized protein LOC126299057 isoform X1 [Schistocerca gregaria]XP_049846676.1 uncharacterized protein LOC126299057 isoform X1 [Schistocerca gre